MIRLALAATVLLAADSPSSILPPDLVGPVAGLVFAISAALALWREHVKSDADLRAQRDLAVEGWRAQTDATREVAAALKVVAGEVTEMKELLGRVERAGRRRG